MKLFKILIYTVLYLLTTPWMIGGISFNGSLYEPIPIFLKTHTTAELLVLWYGHGLIAALMVLPFAIFIIYLMIDNDIL